MPKSECVFGAAAVTMDLLREAGVKQNVIDDEVRWLFNYGKSAAQGVETAVESANFGVEALVAKGRGVAQMAEKNDPWFSKTQIEMAAKKGTPYKREAVQKNTFNQFSIVTAQARLTGQVRAWLTKVENARGRTFGPKDALTSAGVGELATRMRLSDSFLRLLGIPLVTIKAATKGEAHASHLTFGDIVSTMITRGSANEITQAAFRNADQTVNVPFQNIAEAARVIVEHRDLQKAFDPEGLAALKADVLDALVYSSGKSSDSAVTKLQDKNKSWMTSDEGRAIVNDLADAMLSPSTREALLEEDIRQKMIALAFSRGDGIQMTDQVLSTVMDSPWSGKRIEGLGALLFDNGLEKIFGDDFKVLTSLDGSTLAFSEQFLAKTMNQLSPESLAVVKQEYKNAKSGRADARASAKTGKTTNKSKNKARKETNDDIADQSSKIAKDAVANDQNARGAESSLEGAEFAETVMLELRYGSVAGGLAKALSKVSDKAFMSGIGKTLLVGTEHRRLENAAVVSQGLAKLRKDFGDDVEKANGMFEYIKKNLGSTEDSVKQMVAGLPEADRQLAVDMLAYIDNLFGAGEHNMLLQQGIFVDELRSQLRMVGLADEANALEGVVHANDIFEYWRKFDTGPNSDIITTMDKFYTAQQLSMIPASMADSVARHFSHVAEGLSYSDALKQGWKPLSTGSPLGKYMEYGKTPWLFPPDVMPKIKEIERYLAYDRSFGSGKMQDLVRKVDAITSVMKSSLTIWRPGHHVVSTVGNTAMNAIAGVRVQDYGTAVKLMMRRGDINDVDVPALNELLKANVPAGYTMKADALDNVPVLMMVNGKPARQNVSYDDVLKLADAIGGVPISPRRVRDTATADDINSATRKSFYKDNPVSKSVAAVDHQLARVSAARDNVARYALFVKELQTGGPYKNIEDAALAAAQKVHEFHPTVGTLTAGERKFARRAFYFYTWQKQAFFKIMEVAANHPAAFTVPSKFQFSIATAQGLDPESFGDPYSATGLWAAYNENSVYGPQWNDDVWGAMGVKPAAPQLDVIDGYLSPIKFKPEDGLWGNIGNLAADSAMTLLGTQASPLFKIPAELATQRRLGGIGGDITDFPQYMLDQTGVGTLSRVFDWTPWGNRSDTKLDAYSEANRQRLWWNWLGGAKITYYESPAAIRSGRQEQIDYWRKTLNMGKYADKPSIYDLEQ
jgi:hypothetical protein